MSYLRTPGLLGCLCLCLLALLASSCRTNSGGDSADGGAPDANTGFPYPEPRTDLVPSVGMDQTLELATWNIENFPKNDSTPAIVANLIASLDLDMVALQEIQDVAAFDELVARLRGYEGVLSSHTYGDGTYQKVGYIFRSELISVSGAFLLFTQNGYEFPRPPFKVDVTVDNGSRSFTFTSIALHLKAGGAFGDRQRREAAVVLLEDYLRTTVDGSGNGSLMLLGDFNDTLSGGGANVFTPLTGAQDRYSVRTEANSTSGDVSFVPSSVLLDHIVTTAPLDAELPAAGSAIIPRLDMQMTGYVGQVSDHLPVIIRVPL